MVLFLLLRFQVLRQRNLVLRHTLFQGLVQMYMMQKETLWKPEKAVHLWLPDHGHPCSEPSGEMMNVTRVPTSVIMKAFIRLVMWPIKIRTAISGYSAGMMMSLMSVATVLVQSNWKVQSSADRKSTRLN